MQINIKNIRINSISTIGSLNIGKTIFTENRASSAQFPKPYYEEVEPENNNNEEENPPIEFIEVPVSAIPYNPNCF